MSAVVSHVKRDPVAFVLCDGKRLGFHPAVQNGVSRLPIYRMEKRS